MIEQIGSLARQTPGASWPNAGDDGLGRLLAELLGAALGAGVEQLAGIGLASALVGAARVDQSPPAAAARPRLMGHLAAAGQAARMAHSNSAADGASRGAGFW